MVNKVILVGNVGADPEIKTFEDGNKVARIRLATSERVFNPKTQERSEKTQWHTITVWRGLAGVVEQYVRKGTQLFISGKLNYTEWQDSTGNKRYGVEVVADELQMMGKRDSQGAQNQMQQQGGSYNAGQQVQAQAPVSSFPHQQYAPNYPSQPPLQTPKLQSSVENNDYTPDNDDLPF